MDLKDISLPFESSQHKTDCPMAGTGNELSSFTAMTLLPTTEQVQLNA